MQTEALLLMSAYSLHVILFVEFLNSYETIGENIAAFGGPDWRTTTSRIGENDGNFGPGLVRTAVTGSPVVPGSAVKVVEDGEQVLYAITVLRGHYQAGVVVDGVFNAGTRQTCHCNDIHRT